MLNCILRLTKHDVNDGSTVLVQDVSAYRASLIAGEKILVCQYDQRRPIHNLFKNYVEMPKSTSMLYKWQQNQLSRFDAKIKKEIAENKEGTTWSDRRTRLLACIAKKENDNCEEQYAAFVNYVGMPKSRSAL